MKGKKATTAAPSSRATLTTLPEDVLAKIVSHLYRNAKAYLAFSCKALLPILGVGHVRVCLDTPGRGSPLLNATRCLTKQPSGASHLEVVSWADTCGSMCTRHLIDLSLLVNVRQLTLHNVAVSLPALQPAATRLHELDISCCRLQDSADGFLTRGWTALTRLSLTHTPVESATMAAELDLPALEELDIIGFRHHSGVLQLDQLTGSCPNIRGLRFLLDSDAARGREGRATCCSLLKLGRLADLHVCIGEKEHLSVDLDLPASLTLFVVDGIEYATYVDLSWALREAAKCIRRGAQLRRLTCYPAELYLQPAQWGADLDEQYRRLGGQLSSLRELEVKGGTEQLLSALGAIASSAPHLTCLNFGFMERLPRMELPPISSATLESITVTVLKPSNEAPPPPLVLTFLPGCTRLTTVLVGFTRDFTVEGAAAKIRCHCSSPTCIVPMDVLAGAAEHQRVHGYSGLSQVGVRLLPGPPSTQAVPYTVLHACHAAGPQQPLMWGHLVMHGIL